MAETIVMVSLVILAAKARMPAILATTDNGSAILVSRRVMTSMLIVRQVVPFRLGHVLTSEGGADHGCGWVTTPPPILPSMRVFAAASL